MKNNTNPVHTITLLPGDGIGPDIMDSTTTVLDHLFGKNYFAYESVLAGEKALEQKGDLLPIETLHSISKNKIALKSPLNTPKGDGFKSINVTLRQKFNLFANYRPIISFNDTNTRYSNLDIITIRENTEGMYSGEGQVLLDNGERAEAKSVVTRKGSEQIIRFAFDTAKKYNRKKVTLVHKANILKTTSGLFLSVGKEIAKQYPEIIFEEMIVDACCMNLVKHPERFDVIVTTNLFGDILSDLCAGLVGGLGLAPGANIGTDVYIFEAVHGTAPDIAGKDLANPSALMLSACLMLEQLGYGNDAKIWRKAIQRTISDKTSCTKDLGGVGGTKSFTTAVISHISKLKILR
jgi:isocitrate dehydrogenase (NAD+)